MLRIFQRFSFLRYIVYSIGNRSFRCLLFRLGFRV